MAKRKIDDVIQQWLTGDELAFNGILDYYYRMLLTSAMKMVSNREDAEELVMNTLLKIWQHKHRMLEVRHFDDYLFGILRQETAKLSRKQVLATIPIDDLSIHKLGSTDHPECTMQELQSRYRAALDKLTPKQRTIFLAIREQDMSRKEIARQHDMSIHTVNSHMNAAVKILRKELKEYPNALVAIILASPTIGPFL